VQHAYASLQQGLQRNFLLLLFAIYALGCWLFFNDMIVELHGHWVRPNDLDAGYLLLGFTVFLFWQFGRATPTRIDTEDLSTIRVRLLAAVAFLLCLLAAALTAISATKSVTLGLLVVAFVPLAVSASGRNLFGYSLHGSAIIFMATPIWFVIVPGLQALTVAAVNWLLERGRWPVYVEDNLIFLPHGAVEVVAGCAGLKYVQTALALTLIDGYLARRSFRGMAAIALLAFALALLCNWLRVAAITLLALYLDLQHPWVTDHNWVGWVLFALLFGPLFFWLGRSELVADQPCQLETNDLSRRPRASVASAALVLSLGFAGAWTLQQLAVGESSTLLGHSQLAAARTLCQKESASAVDQHPAPASFSGAQLSLDCALGQRHYVSLRGYLSEAQGREVVNPDNQLLPGLGQLDFAVANAWSEANSTEQQTAAPGVFVGPQISAAYGYYAAQQWTAVPEVFKLRSLTRPLYPGPVWALVVIGPTDNSKLESYFQAVTDVMQSATTP